MAMNDTQEFYEKYGDKIILGVVSGQFRSGLWGGVIQGIPD
jgi:hypothetical protein